MIGAAFGLRDKDALQFPETKSSYDSRIQLQMLVEATKLLQTEFQQILPKLQELGTHREVLTSIINCKLIEPFFGKENVQFEIFLTPGGNQIL